MSDSEIEWDLWLDRQIYGACYWRVVDGKKVRVPPHEVTLDSQGRIIEPMDNVQRLPDQLSGDGNG